MAWKNLFDVYVIKPFKNICNPPNQKKKNFVQTTQSDPKTWDSSISAVKCWL